MVEGAPSILLEKLSAKFSLRHVQGRKNTLGVYRGLFIDVRDEGDALHLYFFSPTANLVDQVLHDFRGFKNFDRQPFSRRWLEGPSIGGSSGGCVLLLNKTRLALVSEEDVLNLPERLMQDFLAFGFQESLGTCPRCGVKPTDTLYLVNRTYCWSCRDCFGEVREAPPIVEPPPEIPVDWPRAGVCLVALCTLFAVVWGGLQQPEVGISSRFLLVVVPIMASAYICTRVEKCGTSNALLRVCTASCLLLALLAGNIWGFRSFLATQENVLLSWSDTVEVYFRHQLWNNWWNEAWYVAGGAVGVWIGLRGPTTPAPPKLE